MKKKKLFQKITALFMSLLMLFDVGATYIQADSNGTSMNNSVSAYGTDSFGNMMSDMVNEEAEKIIQNEGYNIFSVIVGGDELNDNEALVSFETLEDATIIVALYDDACEQMLLSEKINVYKDETIAIVEFDTENMPETFYIKAYLVDEESLRPLSTVYESAVYTQEMQEFLDKTVNDFEEDRVFNFDDSVDNNFAVYNENVEVLDSDNSTSKLVSVDEENRKYVFNNADSEITSLKEGDIFVYENEDGTIVIINVASIDIDGAMATVYGQETTMEEVFDYVKIDTNMGTSEAVIDDSNLGEGITNNGYVEYDEPQTYAIISEAKVGGGVKYNIAKREWGDEKNKVEVKGDVELGVEASLKFYLTFSYYYLELKIDYSAKIVVEVTGQVSGEIEMSLFCFSPVPGLYIELTPAIVVELSVEVKVEGKLEGTIGTQKSSDGTSKSLNSTPEFDGSVEVEGKFFIGISLKPRVKLISEKIAKIELEAKVGAEVTVTKKWEPESDTEKHTCKNCLDGDISAVAQVKFEAKFFNNDRFAVKADLLDLKIKICDFYISIDNGEFGFTTCPHISYKITVYVVDSNGKYVMHAMVNEEYSTTDVGYVEMYLPTGDYVIKAVQGKEYGERNVYVADDAREIELYIDENGGSGKNDVNDKNEGSGNGDTNDKGEDEKEDGNGEEGDEKEEDKAEEANYEYEICEDGTVTITGYLGSDTEINIPSKIAGREVSRIGKYAFEGCSSLTCVSLPEGVTSIGGGAFWGCSSLSEIRLPKGVKSIGWFAFSYCSSLCEVSIPEGVTSIEYGAFSGCSSLSEIMIPKGVTSIEDGTFSYCSSLSKISLPEGLIGIGNSAFFGCNSLSEIKLPKGLTSIGDSAFWDCNSLSGISLTEEMTSIGNSVFSGCNSLSEISIPEGVTSIGYGVFEYCSSLNKISLAEGLISIGDSAFESCSSLSEIKLPKGLTSIGKEAFRNCSSLNEISIPERVTSIGHGTFYGCSSLEHINVAERNANYKSIDGVLFSKDGDVLITYPSKKDETIYFIPEGVTSIEERAFYDCSSLSEISLPKDLTSIGDSSFKGCSSLSEISLPQGLTSIGDSTFSGCSSLSEISLPKGLTSIGDSTFSGCSSLSEISLPKGLTSIGDSTFSGCSSLSEMILPEKITNVGDSTFKDCRSMSKISLPEGLTSIGSHAFYGCSSLSEMILPEGLTSIETEVFRDCRSLSEVSLPEGLTSIGYNAFLNCESLNEISLPEGLTSIGGGAFSYCRSLSEISIPEGVTSIGYGAFEDCSSLNKISLPEGLTSIEANTFDGCESLSEISLPEGLISIGGYAFADCNSLNKISLPEGLTSIEANTFDGCESLSEISLPEGLISIGGYAFADCNSLSKISLPEGLICIGVDAFINCRSLSEISLPKGLTSIEKEVFQGCSSLSKISILEGLTSIGEKAFYGCSSLSEISLPEGLTSIGDSTFSGCSSLSEISLPEGLTSIGDSVFRGCISLTEIKLPSTIEGIGHKSIGYNYTYKFKDFIIYGYSSTTAEDYANENGFTFINIQSTPEEVNNIAIETYSIKQERYMEIVESTDIKSPLEANTSFSSETYNDLKPKSIYNFYILKSDSATDRLSSDNLIYITQATSDENGQLNINYIPKEDCEGAVKLLAGMNDYDISDAEITIDDITYTGEQQHVSVEVVYKGETLEQYVDYEISGDYVATEVGEYNIVIEGKGKYTGKSSINFKVKRDFLTGDANNDEKIDTQDAVLLKKYLAGYSDLGINEEACDVNSDGEINSADAVILLKYLAGDDVGLSE